MKLVVIAISLFAFVGCSTIENVMYPGGRDAAKGSTVIQGASKKIGEDPDSPFEVSAFVASHEAFSCQNLGPVSDYGINVSSARNGLVNKAEQMGGNRVFLSDSNVMSGTASGYALKCHPMTGVPQEIVIARCEKKANESACDYRWQYLTSQKEFVEAATLSCTACKAGLEGLCANCQTSKNWIEGEKIKQKLISECNKGNAKSCHKCAFGFYQDGLKEESLKFAQLGCVNGSQSACQFQQALMLEEQANQQAQKSIHLQSNQAGQQETYRNLANTVNHFSEGIQPIQFNEGTCEYRFQKDLSPTGGKLVQRCK
jgi:hypothetical protein